ncbi:hypothetical protein ACFL6U_16110 [Planctomycetota bacterium]
MDDNTKWMRFVGVYLAIWMVLLVVGLFWIWPHPSTSVAQVESSTPSSVSSLDPNRIDPNQMNSRDDGSTETGKPASNSQEEEVAEVLPLKPCPMSCATVVGLVLIMGGLGACLHGITSLAVHRGLNNFSADWTLWYLCRPFVGGILALVFYLVINGGLMPQADDNSTTFFGMLGLSGLIGLFSKQALNKLSIIFDAVFASDTDENQRAGNPPAKPDPQAKPDVPENPSTPEIPPTDTPPEEHPQ